MEGFEGKYKELVLNLEANGKPVKGYKKGLTWSMQ